MSEQPAQNFQNHVRNDPKIISLGLIYLVALIMAGADFFIEASLAGYLLVILVIGALLTSVTARQYSTGLQDRIIMLEMRLRLANVLSDGLKARIPELSRRQLVALRFESDANLNDLTQKVLDENISTGKEIKQLVKDWQADFHRV
jgi:hypothetical protein